MEGTIKYSEAIKQLEDISRKISSGELDIDELASQLAKAKDLVEFCQNKLKNVEADVDRILKEDQ